MAAPGLQDKAVEAVVIMNTAITNLRIYPPTNAMIMKTIDSLYNTLQIVFQHEDELLLSESEKNLLVFGEPLTQRNREKPQVGIFLMLMINWGIKSISFNKNLDRSELTLFLELMGKKPEDYGREGLEQLFSDAGMPNIRINQKVYVEMGKDHEIVSALELTDEDIIRYITAENPDAVLDPEQIKQMAKDPEWVSRIFKSGMHHIVDENASPSDAVLSESMIRMLRSFDKISSLEEKDKLSELAAKSISDMDADFISTMLTKNMDDLLEHRLFDDVIDRIDHEKFERIAVKLHQVIDAADKNGKGPGGESIESVREAYRHLMNTDKGVELQHQIEERQSREKEERENRIREIKKNIDDVMSRLDEGISEEGAGEVLARMLDGLYSEDDTDTAEMTIRQLMEKLKSDHAATRAAASKCLVDVLGNSADQRQAEIVNGHLNQLLEWIQTETRATSAFAVISMRLKNLAQRLIKNGRFEDSLPILRAFHSAAGKGEEMLSVTSAVLRETATDDVLDILMEEFLSDTKGKRNLAGRQLVMTAERSLTRLLDLLRDSENSAERVLILNLIPEMGVDATQAVVGSVDESEPWYFLRNLARLLGRIGREEDAKVLAPLLTHDDERVQKEALKSVNAIGGGFKGEVLLNALSGCDDHLKASIVTVLGSLKYGAAVKPLQELFKSKVNLPDEMKVDLQEKICLALGAIGDKEALPFLAEISKQGGIFGFKSYNPKVRAAAARAADSLS
ncbi:MAG: hypothetical protein JW736_04450 [Deltaproteobacteria bacterium]|nr:hypothetical protein [Deltaproteobacteria bacterium]MBN2687014.1 hypothetical protein [Deltaproteobacteria bacterium]